MHLLKKRKEKSNFYFFNGGGLVQFIPVKGREKKEMLLSVGVSSMQELFKDIPKQALAGNQLDLPSGLNEMELRKEIESIAAKNKSAKQLCLFLGAGCYNHFVPAVVDAVVSRGEFYTAYTPYQPEASQGMLQAIFEWQSWVCLLTGMDLANASMYDGASAGAEAMVMAGNATQRKKVLLAKSMNPFYKAVVKTYANANRLEVREIGAENIPEAADDRTACAIVQQPNFFGCIEQLSEIAGAVHSKGGLLVVCVAEAMSLPFLGKPGWQGADIVAAEMQGFGNRMCFGGPHVGVIACKQRFMRQIPGRLVGKTMDEEGKEGFVLTLQAREQHIRRGKAGSNICSNEALNALAAAVYLASVGEKGLKSIAEENHSNAEYLAEKLQLLGFQFPLGKRFFNEFVVRARNAKKLQAGLLEQGFVFGYALEDLFPEMQDCLLVAVTEMNGRHEIDGLAAELGKML